MVNTHTHTHTAGTILCLLELTSMYNIQLSARSRPLTDTPTSEQQMTDYKRAKVNLSERKRESANYSLTDIQTKPAVYSGGKRKAKKKLIFSKISNDERESVSEMGVARSSAEDKHTVTDRFRSCLSNPRLRIVGVVNQEDVSLPSLCPASVSVCSSLYVPREVRHNDNHTSPNSQNTLENETEGDVAMETHVSHPRIPTSHSCPSVNVMVSSPEPSSPIKESVASSNCFKSPCSKSLNLSHPDMHLFTPPHRHSAKRTSSIHHRRSKSAPLAAVHPAPLDQAITRCLNQSVTVDIVHCTPPRTETVSMFSHGTSLPRGCSSLKVQRSISMSPRFPIIRLRDVLADKAPTCKEEFSKV